MLQISQLILLVIDLKHQQFRAIVHSKEREIELRKRWIEIQTGIQGRGSLLRVENDIECSGKAMRKYGIGCPRRNPPCMNSTLVNK